MSGRESTNFIEVFLRNSSDGAVAEKWCSVLKKPSFNWRRLDVFDLWIGNKLGEKLSCELKSSNLMDLPQCMRWKEDEIVCLYRVGRNRKNGCEFMSLKKALASPFVERVVVFADKTMRAVCVSHEGDVRVFLGNLN